MANQVGSPKRHTSALKRQSDERAALTHKFYETARKVEGSTGATVCARRRCSRFIGPIYQIRRLIDMTGSQEHFTVQMVTYRLF